MIVRRVRVTAPLVAVAAVRLLRAAGVVILIVRVGDARVLAVLLERPDGEKTVLFVVRDLHLVRTAFELL